MQARKFGGTEMQAMPVGFGIRGSGRGLHDDGGSVGAIKRALEHGTGWIDIAAVYASGPAGEIEAFVWQAS